MVQHCVWKGMWSEDGPPSASRMQVGSGERGAGSGERGAESGERGAGSKEQEQGAWSREQCAIDAAEIKRQRQREEDGNQITHPPHTGQNRARCMLSRYSAFDTRRRTTTSMSGSDSYMRTRFMRTP
eukprot:CAMPEP_0174761260 /NCGR_PEP_ID=MMETSP1094-20130205/109185_1 /TAXON_ID=156173 /ORGANISM="Chrysochromulina brevifilum, Strain UTEX LB 985" /LENGTH=126 /DNA_ID=CAMNT_0015967207 /DNA_START=755 /DNA_END=1135 /DNA_ORIENTATION=+